jgi:hypothetical protein
MEGFGKTRDKPVYHDILYRSDGALLHPEILLHPSDTVLYRKEKVSNRPDKLLLSKDKVIVVTKFGPGVRSCIQA